MRLLLLLAALVAACAPACDWTKFDDLALKAGVRAMSRPDEMDSNTYPSVVLPVGKARDNAELLVLGADNVALADFTFGANGHMGTQTVNSARFLLNDTKIGALATHQVAGEDFTVAAYLASAADDVPRIVTALEESRQPVVVTLDSATANFAVTTLGDPLTVEIGAIAVGSTSVLDQTDAVVAAGPQILVFPNVRADSIQTCNLDDAVGAMAVGDQWIAAGQSADPGTVWLLTPPYDAPDADCPNQTVLPFSVGSMGFGTAVLAADVHVDGMKELIVSAPAERTVYVYEPSNLSTEPTRYTVSGGSTTCGSAIAFGVIEGTRTLLIGDPDFTGLGSPGVVWLQDVQTPNVDPVALLSPNTDDVLRFGQQVGVVQFTNQDGDQVDLVWATATSITKGDPGVLYLFFWVNSAGSDPRVFTN